MPRSIIFRPSAFGGDTPEFMKAHVKGYSRKDGAYVQEHDDKRKAAQKNAGETYSHPHAVGKAEITDPHCEGFGDCSGIKFAGTQYFSTGKSGKSFHDETPVREFESEDGHRVWLDDHGRVHADDVGEVDRLRKKGEAAAGKPAGAPAGDGKPKAKETPNVVASKADVINATLGQHNAAAGFISVPPGKGQAKVEDFVEKVKSCGFSLAEGTTYDANGDSVQLSKNENGKAVLEDPDGNRAIIMASDGGDRVRISVSYQPASKTPDKAAGGGEATSSAPKPASAPDGAEKGAGGDEKPNFDDGPDEDNPKYAIQPLSTKVLQLAASGKIDLNEYAKLELKARGKGGDLVKTLETTGDFIDGRGPEHEDQQDDEDPGAEPKPKKKRKPEAEDTLVKSILKRAARIVFRPS